MEDLEQENAILKIKSQLYDDLQTRLEKEAEAEPKFQALIDAHKEENKKLFKALEDVKAAHDVTSLYNSRMTELQELKSKVKREADRKLVNIYAFLDVEGLGEEVKKLLLCQCFFETRNERVAEAEDADGILAMIEEKYAGTPTYPQTDFWTVLPAKADIVKNAYE